MNRRIITIILALAAVCGTWAQETIHNTLPRYLMLHLTYNWSKMPKKR